MGPRALRRRVAVPDDDDGDNNEVHGEAPQDHLPKSRSQGSGKLKSVTNGGTSKARTPKVTSPNKTSKRSAGKAKDIAKTPPKPPGKPIYSFFSVATQSQQASQGSTSTEKPGALHDEVEAIHDDTDDETRDRAEVSTILLKGSSTALAVRKRKFQRTQSFENEPTLPPAASQKFRKASSGDRLSSFTAKPEDKRPWTEQFAPLDLSELAVHKRKVADVRNWLESTTRGRRRKVLVLKGPAGAGKTTTVRLLAKDIGIELLEWRDSTSTDFAADGHGPAGAPFEEFIGRAGRSAGLTLSRGDGTGQAPVEEMVGDEMHLKDCLQVVLIEEFPSTFSKTSKALQSFRSAVAQYVSAPVPLGSQPIPIVMIVSENLLSTNTAASDSFTTYRLLGAELSTNPYIDIIEFNPVAPTYLIKALEVVAVKEARKSGRRRTPGPVVLKQLAETGDIRSAVASLEFLCLRGDDDDIWSSKITFTKSKQSKSTTSLTKSEEEALKLITNRETSLGIFHSVGKVVYNKRADPATTASAAQTPIWLPQNHRRQPPETDANSLIDELGTDISTFIAALHQNYALSCSRASSEDTLHSLLGCMDNLSDADLLSLDRFAYGTRAFAGSAVDSLRQDEMSFQIAVRGILFSLPHPVHRSAGVGVNRADAHRMLYPASLKLWRKKEEVSGQLELLINRLVTSEISGTGKPGQTITTIAGVEGWKRDAASEARPAAIKSGELDALAHTSMELRNEMLTDRLPYMAQIYASPKAAKVSHLLLENIIAVTGISGLAPAVDDDMEDENEDSGNGAEQWTTDPPNVENNSKIRTAKKPALSSKQKSVFDAMSIPVESRVEKLVLEDDDIVDD